MSVNNRRTKLLFKILLGQLGVTLIIVLMALSILFYAEGYRFNYKNFKFTRTGVLSVITYPKNAQIFLDGKLESEKSPFSRNLMPSRYTVLVQKEGCSPWISYARVDSELVTEYKNVVLFFTNPIISDLNNSKIINQLDSPVDDLAIKNSHGLVSNSYEIWANNNLVTRFSEPISKAIWYPSDLEHIIYQQGNQIRIIEIFGTNDTLLVTLSSGDPTNIIVNDKGEEIYFIDGGSYKTAKIR